MSVLGKIAQIIRAQGAAAVLPRMIARLRGLLRDRRAAAAHRRALRSASSFAGPVQAVAFAETPEAPLVSVVIPAYNNCRATFRCLQSLSSTALDGITAEIIVVDDASTDETPAFLRSCSGIRVVRNDINSGFVTSCNRGAALARGTYIVFLNNDTLVLPRWLSALVAVVAEHGDVAAVGSQLLYPDGRIAEAGAIVWNTGEAWNYGRLQSPDDPQYGYLRAVDYCSAASLLVRADMFRTAGGFSEAFSPGYYEDVDLCFQLRALGSRVMYQPLSRVVHFEGLTGGADRKQGMKRFQDVHRATFAQKWKRELAAHFPPDAHYVEDAARRLRGEPRVLVLDDYVPFHDRSAGAKRLREVLEIMLGLGASVTFASDEGSAHQPYTAELQELGIEVCHRWRGRSQSAQVKATAARADVAWVSRPQLCEKYFPLLERHPGVKKIYDTVDLHYRRLAGGGTPPGGRRGWHRMREREFALARAADLTIVTTPQEEQLLQSAGIARTLIVPVIASAVTETPAPYGPRRNLLFLGNYTHKPNEDGALWFCEHVLPLVREALPDVRVTLAGAEPTAPVRALAGRTVKVTGYVADLDALFREHRVFIAPLRYGAGIKGKIIEALARGIPVVTTSVGAEGIGLRDRASALIADSPEAFARAILESYNDPDLWRTLSEGGRVAAAAFSPESVAAAVADALRVSPRKSTPASFSRMPLRL